MRREANFSGMIPSIVRLLTLACAFYAFSGSMLAFLNGRLRSSTYYDYYG
jgi:hypothetical protein